MSGIDNGQHWLDRNRPPRVQITYDVEIGDAVEKKELPLVVGILADLDGTKGKVVAEQAFREIDGDNFDEMLKEIAPTVTLNLPASSQLAEHKAAKALEATFTFTQFDHFNPVELLRMVPALKELYEERQRLRDMLARLDGNVKLGEQLDAEFRSVRPAPGGAPEKSGKSGGKAEEDMAGDTPPDQA
ncbi:type VI secretion system contractile sheath small subunit [Massilia sp. Dwa41.01b]|uniref:type VI secretion system contractile sheath small subunit n=1 Tax=unclassified Massilia TaxID=2609279 RepID=UPI0015FF572C|nr:MULTISPECIES: type VI secretion system contractile sheath small subunit [unclassified Massilia]QNA89239.1 type VI secretion system contractile sheath small subunit [Massilia sp. Dwa41.01b]QNB00142.1 type VI secretion system contractile sheath small subunit [Massilia sp. Se16.2.3]